MESGKEHIVGHIDAERVHSSDTIHRQRQCSAGPQQCPLDTIDTHLESDHRILLAWLHGLVSVGGRAGDKRDETQRSLGSPLSLASLHVLGQSMVGYSVFFFHILSCIVSN